LIPPRVGHLRGTQAPARPARPLPHAPALDGLRGIAVVAVILFHLKTRAWFPGGFVGVDVFFVLSGFLITRILLDEWNDTGTISLSRFYGRRAWRLLPAALLFFAGYVVLVDGVVLLRGDSTSLLLPLENVALSLVYVFNWVAALRHPISPAYSHIWSLSVEEQFYLVWPVFLLLLLRARVSTPALLAITVVLAVASAAMPMMVAAPTWQRLYYGTDFRVHALFMGSAVALLSTLPRWNATVTRSPLFRGVVAIAAVFLVSITLLQHGHTAWMFFGGHQAVALAAALVVAACAFDGAGIATGFLASAPARYLGRRSYALYLWNPPIAYYLAGLGLWPQLVLTSMLTLAIAEFSYRFVERPALRRKDRLRPASIPPPRRPGRRTQLAA
jgi:peptidoglycan/LPS O-acetylase OafA/YrhL